MHTALIRLLALLAALLLVAACAPDDDAEDVEVDEPDVEASYNDADVEFLQMMIPHHEQAIEMAELVPDRTDREELLELSDSIIAGQQAEIDVMTQMLHEAGAEPMSMDGMGHGDHGMPGMMDENEMEELAAAEGDEFDRQFAEMMIDHHDGAVVMSSDVLEDGQHPDVAALAEDIIEEQEAEIETMRQWLEEWDF